MLRIDIVLTFSLVVKLNSQILGSRKEYAVLNYCSIPGKNMFRKMLTMSATVEYCSVFDKLSSNILSLHFSRIYGSLVMAVMTYSTVRDIANIIRTLSTI